jgi:multidrug efflux pump subunit AcrB
MEGQGVQPGSFLPGIFLVPRKTPLFAATFLACGPTRDGLHQVGQRLKQWVEKQPGVLTAELLGARMASDVQIRVDRDRAARLGVEASVITERVAAALEGIEVPPTGRPRIRVHMDPSAEATLQAITGLSVPTATGKRVPIAHIASLVAVASPVALLRHNQRPCMAVRGWSQDPPKASALITSLAEHVPLPPGFTVEWSPDWD